MITISEFDFKNPRFTSLLNRQAETPVEIISTVSRIIQDIKENGDSALYDYMQKFDNINLYEIPPKVTDDEFEEARLYIEDEYREALKQACDNLFKFHQYQLPKSYKVDYQNGVVLKRNYRPIERVGVCVPGQTAPLSSSLYMNIIPALVAGVPEIYIISAPVDNKINHTILYIADYLGVKNVYKISGAQGVAALAFGTESISKVDKVVGPGNIYVQTAKKQLFGTVGIDSIAGPSEIAIIADDSANARYVAADLLSQAEHGTGMEASVAFCLSKVMAQEIQEQLLFLSTNYDLEEIVYKALDNYGNIFIVDSIERAVDAVNFMAPEHTEIICQNGEEIAEKITNSGAVFIGPYSPEPVGDYFCGTNHVLPTGGTARFLSGLSVLDFIRSYSTVSYTETALKINSNAIKKLAEPEGMKAHSLSISVREEE
jgi:histidinol dehydrogenase